MIMMYKILHGLDGIPFDALFSYHHTATRSNGYKLYKNFATSTVGNISFRSGLLMIGIIFPKKLSNQIMYGLLNLNLIYTGNNTDFLMYS